MVGSPEDRRDRAVADYRYDALAGYRSAVADYESAVTKDYRHGAVEPAVAVEAEPEEGQHLSQGHSAISETSGCEDALLSVRSASLGLL